ncbi:MAG: hypothetical protein L6R42_001519 [Xanthoria sp. 1 TBL-2021]|nr:MAG: hypothetical protein L6R42_001519 [Xanthoria sp. 1 TBL-2021]
MRTVFSHQLMTLIWTVITVAICCVRVPLLGLYYLPRASRRHPKWTYRQAMGVELLRIWFAYASTVKFRFPISLKPGTERERFVVIQPSTRGIYGALPNTSKSTVKPKAIGGTWYPRVYNACVDKTQQVILHFHGGGYVLGSTRDSECRSAALALCKDLNALSFFPQYRLASSPDGRFPAAFQDALTAYAYLIDVGVRSSNIVLSGDSAGGHLVVMLLRYLSENHGLLGDPRAALLWSPWLNLAVDPADIDRSRNSTTDFVLGAFVRWAVESFVPPDMDLMHPYLSPLYHPFSTQIPIWVQVGRLEVLHEEAVLFADRMLKMMNIVELLEVSYAPHDIFLAGSIVGFERELVDATKVAAEFLTGKRP